MNRQLVLKSQSFLNLTAFIEPEFTPRLAFMRNGQENMETVAKGPREEDSAETFVVVLLLRQPVQIAAPFAALSSSKCLIDEAATRTSAHVQCRKAGASGIYPFSGW